MFFQVFEGEAERGGPAVGAIAGAIDEMSAGEERFDFAGREGVAGFDGGFAGHHVEDFVEEFFVVDVEGFAFAALEDFLEEFDGVQAVEEAGKGVDADGIGAD